MEDMARLALVEQGLKVAQNFGSVLCELLHNIDDILEYPYNNEFRTLKSDIIKDSLNCEAFKEYLKYIGFQAKQSGEFIYPKEECISKLRQAKEAIERKISLCCDPQTYTKIKIIPKSKKGTVDCSLKPVYVLKTNNKLLHHVQHLFNDVLKYEDKKLQQKARDLVPLVTLKLRALERMRAHQKKIKLGETKEHDMTFETALLLELMGWFKHRFFRWVNAPPCNDCGEVTEFLHITQFYWKSEVCDSEVYNCTQCGKQTDFIRYNDLDTLLLERQGRCGEWANTFTLFCRALGYETRFVYD
ncbi:unnamed protein product, partial [Leptidea sinapis]